MAAPQPSTTTVTATPVLEDPFDTLLTLEDTLYTTAYTLGTNDGARAGRIEGRIFGLEKGFEKFAALGELHGRACVWGGRTPNPSQTTEKQEAGEEGKLPKLKENSRLEKNVRVLHSLTDPSTFSTENTEDAVADFDDRFKRAGAKAKIIEHTISESTSINTTSTSLEGSPSTSRKAPPAKGRKVKLANEGKVRKEDSMEDFTGSRLLR